MNQSEQNAKLTPGGRLTVEPGDCVPALCAQDRVRRPAENQAIKKPSLDGLGEKVRAQVYRRQFL